MLSAPRLWLSFFGAVALGGCVDDIVYGSSGGGGGGADTTATGGTTTGGTTTGGTTTGGTTTGGTTTGAGGGAATTGAGGGECGSGAECVPLANGGWQGPALLMDGSSCPGNVAKLHALGAGASASGVCPCQPGATPPCTPPTSSLYPGGGCAGAPDPLVLGGTNCENINVGADDGAETDSIPAVNPAAGCVVGGAGAPPPTLNQEASLCDSAAGACTDGDCLGAVASGDSCVFRTDASDCSTAGAYTVDRSLVTASASCTCTGITAGCGGQTLLYGKENCQAADLKVSLNHPSACVSTGGTTQSAKFVPTNASLFAGQCATPPPTVATAPMQICCLP